MSGQRLAQLVIDAEGHLGALDVSQVTRGLAVLRLELERIEGVSDRAQPSRFLGITTLYAAVLVDSRRLLIQRADFQGLDQLDRGGGADDVDPGRLAVELQAALLVAGVGQRAVEDPMFEHGGGVIGIRNAVVLVIRIIQRLTAFTRCNRRSHRHQIAQLGRAVLDHVVGARLADHQVGEVADGFVVELIGLGAGFLHRGIEFTDLGGTEVTFQTHEDVALGKFIALAAIGIDPVLELINHRHVGQSDILAALEPQARRIVLVLHAPGGARFLGIQTDLVLLPVQPHIESTIDLRIGQRRARQRHKASNSHHKQVLLHLKLSLQSVSSHMVFTIRPSRWLPNRFAVRT